MSEQCRHGHPHSSFVIHHSSFALWHHGGERMNSRESSPLTFPVPFGRLLALGPLVGLASGTLSYILQGWLIPSMPSTPQGQYGWVVLFNVLSWTVWLASLPVAWMVADRVPDPRRAPGPSAGVSFLRQPGVCIPPIRAERRLQARGADRGGPGDAARQAAGVRPAADLGAALHVRMAISPVLGHRRRAPRAARLTRAAPPRSQRSASRSAAGRIAARIAPATAQPALLLQRAEHAHGARAPRSARGRVDARATGRPAARGLPQPGPAGSPALARAHAARAVPGHPARALRGTPAQRLRHRRGGARRPRAGAAAAAARRERHQARVRRPGRGRHRERDGTPPRRSTRAPRGRRRARAGGRSTPDQRGHRAGEHAPAAGASLSRRTHDVGRTGRARAASRSPSDCRGGATPPSRSTTRWTSRRNRPFQFAPFLRYHQWFRVLPRGLAGGLHVGCRYFDRTSRRPRRSHAQPEGRRRHPAHRRVDRRHRRQRVGQVLARLRHDLRRGPAALRGVAVGLRAAVPRADGEARRRPDRGHLPGDRDPPEEQHPQPAIDRGHHHGDPRLHAPAVGARRQDALPAAAGTRSRAKPPTSWRGAWPPCRRGRGCWWGSRCRSSRVPDQPPAADLEEGDSGEAEPAERNGNGSASSAATERSARRSRACRGAGSGGCWSTARPSASRTWTWPRWRGRAAIQVVVDRIQIDGEARARLADSIETAYREGGGAAFALQLARAEAGSPTLHQFSERFECRRCNITYEDPQPRLFSFNNPFGACPTCHGFGNVIELDMTLVVPDPTKSIRQGAIEPWTKPHYRSELAELKREAKRLGIPLDTPWQDLTDDQRRLVVEGDGAGYGGIRGFFGWLERKKYKVHVRVFLSRYRGYLTCPDCNGTRLRREARDVRVGGKTIDRVSALTVSQAPHVLRRSRARRAGRRDCGEGPAPRSRGACSSSPTSASTTSRWTGCRRRCRAANRSASTWRPRSGSALVDTLYVLDEPSIGLHPRDNLRLIAILRQLRDQGNTVVVVEHDADMIGVADYIVDLGLGAGEQGGRVVFEGTLEGLRREPRSLTAKYLREELSIAVPATRRRGTGQRLRITGAASNNLKHVDVAFPLGTLTCHHRRQRLGQVHAGARHHLRRREAGEGRVDGRAQARHVHVDRGHRVHLRHGAGGSDADRAHAAQQSGHLSQGLRPHPRAVRGDEGRAQPRASRPATSPSTCQAAGARRAKARARSASRCSSWPTCSFPAISATASASSRRCSR